jgi:Tfp pilus assembly protein PilF
MIGVADGKNQLSVSIVEKPDRIFALQDRMYTEVRDALDLQTQTVAVSQKSYTENNEAFQLYLKAEYSRQKGSPVGTAESLDLYKQAIELDPNFALAYQGLSLAYRSSPAYGAMSPQEAFPKAKEAAQKALSLDPSMSTAYASLASIKATYDWDFAGAEQEYKRAIQLSPNNAEVHYSYGNFLVAMGRTDEALVELRNALQIDPNSANFQTNIGWALYIAGRDEQAAAQLKQVIDRDPSFARAHLNLGEILEEQGKHEDAIVEIQKARELSKDPLADMALGHAFATAGRRDQAVKMANDLEERVRQKQVSPFLPAVIYAGLKENDKAFYWLERAYQERSNWLTLLKGGPPAQRPERRPAIRRPSETDWFSLISLTQHDHRPDHLT